MQTSTVLAQEGQFSECSPKGEDEIAETGRSPYDALVDMNPDNLTSLARIEGRLVVLFKDGSHLTVENFFDFERRYQSCLKKMSPGGDIWPALSEAEAPVNEVKYNFAQPATAWAFGGSVLFVVVTLGWFW